MVFGLQDQGKSGQVTANFQFPVGIRWCSDGVKMAMSIYFHLDFQFPVGIRWCSDYREYKAITALTSAFNSLWELDGVRTRSRLCSTRPYPVYFQFPVGIRWCSDIYLISIEVVEDEIFQFPVGIRWYSDVTRSTRYWQNARNFQFPVGIRWCSD